ncbi:excisionase family DNA binding protein [Mycetocola sp. BIGb0189]|uniref:helix-turn-helix domain-containing protein n=1 Tax=Mycetocola sp. BIGb0189 TaxID=2940604 RepID=UPI00216815AA|nr:helix-turn-helix domain-containing protein [Mycetocola sp. BIGb0189]MCS4275229.1 excisionase family DNA binding protein [Mycetocola sp. BIGb0189]
MSTNTPLVSETYDVSDEPGIARVHDFFVTHSEIQSGRTAPRYVLSGNATDDQVELPAEIYHVLVQVVDAMRRGLSVTVSPRGKTLTTQQTADLLGVSRPTVIKLLDEGRIPFERVGTHRRVTLTNVLEYRKRRREEQYATLARLSTDVDDDAPLNEVLAELKKARRVVSERRRQDIELP